MRRPLKPFVTEYKQSNRRSSSNLAEQSTPEARWTAKPVDVAFPGSDVSYEAALRAADAFFSNSSSTPAYENPDAERFSPPEPVPGMEKPGTEKNGGRILRAIDEEPLPQLAALEAERAPKRRGRKPGSKNKPKVALVAEPHEPSPSPVIPPAAVMPPTASPTARVEALTVATRNAKRNGWGRGRLRPGEDWKRRRLPRVCW